MASNKLMKKDRNINFRMKTVIVNNMTGEVQYTIRHRVWMIGLNMGIKYIFDPNKRELIVMSKGPTQSKIKMLVNASSGLCVLKAANPAVTNEITNGPHKSHYFYNLA